MRSKDKCFGMSADEKTTTLLDSWGDMLKFLGKAIYIACWLLQHYLSKKCGVGLASTEIPDLKSQNSGVSVLT